MLGRYSTKRLQVETFLDVKECTPKENPKRQM